MCVPEELIKTKTRQSNLRQLGQEICYTQLLLLEDVQQIPDKCVKSNVSFYSKTIHGCSLLRDRLQEQHIISFRACHATCTVFLHNAIRILREIQTTLQSRHKQIQYLDDVVEFVFYTSSAIHS